MSFPLTFIYKNKKNKKGIDKEKYKLFSHFLSSFWHKTRNKKVGPPSLGDFSANQSDH